MTARQTTAGTEYDDPSGKRGARCATCGDGEAVVLDPAPAPQVQVRGGYPPVGHPKGLPW